MPAELIMPQLDMSMAEGQLSKWLVADGTTVTQGQTIYTIEADKAIQEIDAPATGTLRQIGIAGETYQVGVKIGEIV